MNCSVTAERDETPRNHDLPVAQKSREDLQYHPLYRIDASMATLVSSDGQAFYVDKAAISLYRRVIFRCLKFSAST